MTTINFGEYLEKTTLSLEVPENTESMTVLEAGLRWAESGFYVLPIENETKNPGSVVGSGWHHKSSREPEAIKAWFSSGNYGIALHVGKSGAIAFDVDEPSRVPARLRQWIDFQGTPFQSTREDNLRRGHYLFATVGGATYGNSNGKLGNDWGEVRGSNGIIVVAPTVHQKRESGGRYKWLRTGTLPYLPNELSKLLPGNTVANSSVDLKVVESFMSKHTDSQLPWLLSARLDEARPRLKHGSRHNYTRNLLLSCLRESMAGLYSARECVESIAELFISRKPMSEWSSPNEFVDMVRWAVAQVLETPQEELTRIQNAYLVANSAEVKRWMDAHK